MELLTRKLMFSWSWNTSKGWINSPNSLFFLQTIGPVGVLRSESLFFLAPFVL